jgi:hypothetical protein
MLWPDCSWMTANPEAIPRAFRIGNEKRASRHLAEVGYTDTWLSAA